MEKASIILSDAQLNGLFPFHFKVDPTMRLIGCGKSLSKIVSNCLGAKFESTFRLLRPLTIEPTFENLQGLVGQMLVIELLARAKTVLRGTFEYFPATDTILFAGSPWFDSVDQVVELNLVISDFAVQDPMIDLLHVLKTQEIGTEDIKQLLNTVNLQRKALERDKIELQRLSLVARANHNGVVFTDPQGTITWCNEGFCNMSGYIIGEIIGKAFVAMLCGPLSDQSAIRKMVDNCNDGISVELELICYRKDAGWFWGNVKSQAILNERGEIQEFFAIVEDVHARTMAQQRLEASESRLSTVIRNMDIGLLLEDEHRKIVLVNRVFCDLFGIPAPPAALVGADCANSAEESKGLFEQPELFVSRIQQILKGRVAVTGEALLLQDGRIFERAYLPIFEFETYKGHLWSYQDTTETVNHSKKLRMQEEKYRNIIANMNLGLIEVDLEEKVKYANQSFLEMSGYELEDLVGRDARKLLMDESARMMMDEKQRMRHEGNADMYEIPVRNLQGDIRWWIISGAPSYDDAGNLIGSIGIHLDITAQKLMEQELIVAKAKAEESSRAKEIFLANMSHEMRTPLNAIIGVFRELKRTDISPANSSYVEKAHAASDHLLSMINNILDISKIEAGELRIEKQHFSIRKVLAAAIDIVHVEAQKKHLTLKNIVDPEVAEVYIGDDLRIRQVLLNLLSNAIKFTEQGSVTVICTVQAANATHQTLRIAVTDTGIGMEKAFLENIFHKFSQEDASTGRRYGGTGLGMAISHELIQMMGGDIYPSSQLGKGTTIEVILPMPFGNPELLQIEEVAGSLDFQELVGKHILLAEDNPMNRMVAQASLRHYGIELTEAENGRIAVALMRTQQFDLVLMDVQMPEMDGLSATKEIRTFDLHTPIVALSANAFQREIDQCLAAGMNGYVTKPFEEIVLLQTIQRLCGHAEAIVATPIAQAATTSTFKLYDLIKIRDIARGNEGFVKQMVDLFIDETPRVFANMETAWAAQDYPKLKGLAHRIKPSVEAMGMPALHNVVKKIEVLSLQAPEQGALRTLLDQAQVILAEAILVLQTDFP